MKTKLLKILLFVALGGVLLLAGAYAGYRGYKSIRQARLVKEAREYLEKNELRKAQLCLQRAVRYNNRDLETCRLMAQLSDASGSRTGALVWRGRVVELNPTSLEDRVALVQAALADGDYATATNTIAGFDQSGRKTSAYHKTAGAVAGAANRFAEAETHFREALRLEPGNALIELDLARSRLRQTNAPALMEARNSLNALAANPTNSALRCQALRDLAGDALRSRQMSAADALSKQLLLETNSVFVDRLFRLEVLQAARSDQFNPTLAAFQRECVTNPAALYQMCRWHYDSLGPRPTLSWLRTLPMETQTNQPAALFIANSLEVTKDWEDLFKTLDQQNWYAVDYLRRALKARALRGKNLAGAAKGEWELALKEAGSNPDPKGSLVRLMGLAAQWGWLSEAEEVLGTIVKRFPGEKWAFQALSQTLYEQGRTRPLMMLYTQELQRAPKDLSIKNNLAVTALLLEANEMRPHDLALEVYQKAPTNAAYASTYAFSLHVQAKDQEALKIIQTLSPKALEDPSISGYYGLILKATGNSEKAKTYLNWALKRQLLPEEKKLFERAKGGA